MDKDNTIQEIDIYREEYNTEQYHDINEYHSELAEEFAEEFN